jgi:hypothetical protein
MWFELVNVAHSETPVGTLPKDMKRLSRMIQPVVDQDHFERLCKMDFGPLHGWEPCLCGDEVRLMHPVVTRIVLAAFSSRSNHAARVEAASEARKLKRVTDDVGQIAPHLASDPRKVRWISAHIDEAVSQRGGSRRTAEDLHVSIQACIAQDRQGSFTQRGGS